MAVKSLTLPATMSNLAKLPTPEQIAAIRFAYLTDGQATIKALAETHDLPIHRVSALLKGPDFDKFRDAIQTAIAGNAKDILHRSVEHAAESWVKTFPAAIAKGDHRPMKDLLTATHVIDPEAKAPAVVVQIGVLASDVHISAHPTSHAPSPPAIDVVPE